MALNTAALCSDLRSQVSLITGRNSHFPIFSEKHAVGGYKCKIPNGYGVIQT